MYLTHLHQLVTDYGMWVNKFERLAVCRMNRLRCNFCIILPIIFQSWLVVFAVGEELPQGIPAGYRLIGSYELNSKLRVENGVSQSVVISPLVYRVYSDGIDLRVYCETADEDSYTVYQIYRSDGVGVIKKTREIELVAGVQAYSTNGNILRQNSVTRNSFTMVQTPPRSHRVIITRAIAKATPADVQSEE